MNFSDQSKTFLECLQQRRRRPVKPATLCAYEAHIKNWILPILGEVELESFGNGAMKDFAGRLAELRPKTIHAITGVVKQIVASAITPDGNPLYPRTWNASFIDLPPVEGLSQPVLTEAQVARAVNPRERYRLLYAFLAGTGLRIGEALAVRVGDDGLHTAWDPGKAVISVRTAFWRDREQSTKTRAGVRLVDVEPALNRVLLETDSPEGGFLFQNSLGGRLWPSYVRDESLKPLEIQGFHSFRRFRITHLAGAGVPRELIEYWAGHALPGLAGIYTKLGEGERIRKDWVKKAGLGFEVHVP